MMEKCKNCGFEAIAHDNHYYPKCRCEKFEEE